MIYREAEEAPYPLIMTVAVPRKNINHATDRNLIKRRTREAYRLRKNQAFSDLRSSGRKYQVVFIYQASELAEYRTIDNSIGALLHVLIKA
jgi:ribonuclease P protein component